MYDYVFVLQEEPLEPGLKLLPLFYALTIVINMFSIFYDGPESKYMNLEVYPSVPVFVLNCILQIIS